jgi:hypothetical protein
MFTDDIHAYLLALRRFSRKVNRTPETARQFLIDAGIETVDAPVKRRRKSKKKST